MHDVAADNDTRLVACFLAALELDEGDEVRSLEYQGIPTWDSVGHLALVAHLEETFDIMLDTDDVIDMSSFEAARTILARYGVTFG